MDLLAAASDDLTSHDIPHALIGAMALAAHGIARASLDSDVLVVMANPPGDDVWVNVRKVGARVETRLGDADDPFRAVVRITKTGSAPVDVLVGRSPWQREVIARARRVTFSASEIPVVSAADLILLKLFAGGPQDLWDVQRLLSSPSRDAMIADVEKHIAALPASCRAQWERVKTS